MDVFMRQHMRMNSSEFQLPKEGSIYDYLYDTSRSPCGKQPVRHAIEATTSSSSSFFTLSQYPLALTRII